MNGKPFLRWVGGKGWLNQYIDELLPEYFENYYEPFLGGGSIFFLLKSKGLLNNKAFLSDLNKDLITTYKVIQKNPEELFLLLKKQKNTEEEYYRIRCIQFDNNIEIAAQFMFLNKTSFNGIFRVNKQGTYNVPYGYRNFKKGMYDFDFLYQTSDLLKSAYLSVKDFKEIKNKIKVNDLIYFDPPYTVAHENNGFIQYNQSIFSWNNQIQLSKLLEYANEIGTKYILSNAYHHNILELYNKHGKQYKISRASTIGGVGAKRQKYNEIIISNI